nr:hypothetical protein Iba_chr05fCG9660 [Ipomoea batatas]
MKLPSTTSHRSCFAETSAAVASEPSSSSTARCCRRLSLAVSSGRKTTSGKDWNLDRDPSLPIRSGVKVPDRCRDPHSCGAIFSRFNSLGGSPVLNSRKYGSPTPNSRSGKGDEVPEPEIAEPGESKRLIGLPGSRSLANGTSGEEGVVKCTDSGGGVKGAVEEGGSDWRKDAGEEGGATKGSIIEVEVRVGLSTEWRRSSLGAAASGSKTACTIRLFCGF